MSENVLRQPTRGHAFGSLESSKERALLEGVVVSDEGLPIRRRHLLETRCTRRAVQLGLVLLVACESTPAVLYHSIGEPVDPPRWVSVTDFVSHLEMLRDEGYTPITTSELDRIMLDGRPGPNRPVVLTFDDGYANFYRHAYPVLREHGVKATMFLISARIGHDEPTRVRDDRTDYLIWPEILEMQDHGIEFQSHTVDHARLDSVDLDRARFELASSKTALEEGLGRPVTVLAYPFGVSTAEVRSLAADVGYRSAYSVGAGITNTHQRLRVSMHASSTREVLREAIGATWWGRSSGAR